MLFDLRAIGRVAPDARFVVGEIARFSVDVRKVCIFDAETERLIV